jgi:ATP-dependent Clp protease ATP-binding subunit ClpC
MFERYSEKARRVIFFARYEASEVGSPYIESDHLLIGLLRESGPALRKHMGGAVTMEELRAEITASTLRREPTSTSVDLTLSNECKRILAYAAEEAQRLAHEHIGTEHLMLGILREKDCFAARLLHGRGMNLETARRAVEADARLEGGTSASGIGSGMVPRRNLRGFRIVDVETSETLLTSADSASVPRIGESILIVREENTKELFRVRDVVWEFTVDNGVSQPGQLVVKVGKT